MVATYISGTQPWPVILIDIEDTIKAIGQSGENIIDAIKTSIVHELGHAIQEGMNMPFIEEEAEEFAQLYQANQLWKFWE